MPGDILNLVGGLLGVLVAYAVGSRADGLGRRLGLLDFPDPFGGRKRHDRVTPLVGGIAIVGAFEMAAVLVLAWMPVSAPEVSWHLAWVAGAVLVMSLIGLADDRLGLSPTFRLVATTIVLLLTITYAPDFRVDFLRFSWLDQIVIFSPFAATVFTLLSLIGLLNAVNMADGKNGIVITLSLIWTALLFAKNPNQFDPLLFAVIGALIVLLAYNMRGALFLGDGGSYGVSAIFGLLVIYAYNHNFATFGASQVAIMFLVPIVDTMRLMTWRVLQGRSPFSGDRRHLHHYLHARWGWPAGLVIYGTLVAIPNLLALVWPVYSLPWLGLAFALYVATLWISTRRTSLQHGFST